MVELSAHHEACRFVSYLEFIVIRLEKARWKQALEGRDELLDEIEASAETKPKERPFCKVRLT